MTDLLINPNGAVFATGFLPKKQVDTISANDARRLIKLLANEFGKTVTNESPLLSGYVESLSLRIEAALPPASKGTGIAIRKLASEVFSLESYEEQGIMTKNQKAAIEEAIAGKANIILSGSTGSGKTTLLNALIDKARELTPTDRVITIEDTEELVVNMPDSWQLFTSATISLEEQVRRCLRRRPDRVIVGEVRDGTMLDILNLWNTGHAGGMATLHAGRTPYKALKRIGEVNLVTDTLERIEDMLAQRATISDHLRRIIGKSVDVVIPINRYSFEEAVKMSGKDPSQMTIGDQIRVDEIQMMRGFVGNNYELEPIH